MSFEGWIQVLCKNGHYYQADCYSYIFGEGWTCQICGAKKGWSYTVDCTNDCGEQFDLEPYLRDPAVFETCPTCKHEKQITPDVYNIPEL